MSRALAMTLGIAGSCADDRPMHIQLATALILTALGSSLVLFVDRRDRVLPLIALAAAGLEAVMHFDLLSISSGKFRIDVIVPALLVIAGAACWARSSTKATHTAATLVLVVGLLQLLRALSVLA